MVGAVMLGLGRAMGETIAVALVIGSNAADHRQLFSPGDSMPAVIANEFGEVRRSGESALIGLGVVLFVLTIVVNLPPGPSSTARPEDAGRHDRPPSTAPTADRRPTRGPTSRSRPTVRNGLATVLDGRCRSSSS